MHIVDPERFDRFQLLPAMGNGSINFAQPAAAATTSAINVDEPTVQRGERWQLLGGGGGAVPVICDRAVNPHRANGALGKKTAKHMCIFVNQMFVQFGQKLLIENAN